MMLKLKDTEFNTADMPLKAASVFFHSICYTEITCAKKKGMVNDEVESVYKPEGCCKICG